MQHWLGNAKLDRFVFRALKQMPHAGCRPITALTQHLLHREGLLKRGQVPPSVDDVYVSLLRLVVRRRVEKCIDFKTGGIRYSVRVYPG